jgi:hypothetical protein
VPNSPGNLDRTVVNMIYREPTGQSKGKSMGERRRRQVVVALVLVLGISKFCLAAAPPEKLRVAYTASLTGLASIVDFRAEMTAEVKKLTLEKMFDNSLLQEIQKESAQTK